MATTVPLGNPFVGVLPMTINYNTAYRFTPPFGTWAVGWRGKIEFIFTPDELFPLIWFCSVLLSDYSIIDATIESIGSSRKYVLDFLEATGDLNYIQFYASSGSAGNCILDSVVYPPLVSIFWTNHKGHAETE